MNKSTNAKQKSNSERNKYRVVKNKNTYGTDEEVPK